MGKFSTHLQCQTCWESFPSNDDLKTHLDDYRSKEHRLKEQRERLRWDEQQISSQLEQCRSHSLLLTDLPNDIEKTTDARSCPVEQCTKHFRRRRDLRVHFESHIPCFERCVICTISKDFTTSSAFIKHFKRHESELGTNERKYQYMLATRNELRAEAEKELERLLQKQTSIKNDSVLGKRALPDTEENTSSKKHNTGSSDAGSLLEMCLGQDSQIRSVPGFDKYLAEAIDSFAPPLFQDNLQQAELLDPPLFNPVLIQPGTHDPVVNSFHLPDSLGNS